MINKELDKLRKTIKIKIIRNGLDQAGYQKRIAKRLGLCFSAVNMSLTGYRVSESSRKVLLQILDLVEKSIRERTQL